MTKQLKYCMKKLVKIFFLLILLQSNPIFANQNINLTSGKTSQYNSCIPTRTLEYLSDGVKITYSFESANTCVCNNENEIQWKIDGFCQYMEPGFPDLPVKSESFYIPKDYDVELEVESSPHLDINTKISNAPYPGKEGGLISISKKSNYSGFFPAANVVKDEDQYFRGFRIISLNISPLLYNMEEQRLRCYSSISFTLKYRSPEKKSNAFTIGITTPAMNSHPIALLSTPIIEPSAGLDSTNDNDDILPASFYEKNMLIICPRTLLPAANRLASWKRALGYKVTVSSNIIWTQAKITNTITTEYKSNLNLRYVLFLGNSNLLPAHLRTFTYTYIDMAYEMFSEQFPYATDRPYVCLDGEDDLTPEFYYGRIPVGSLDEANNAIDKIIAYEGGQCSNSFNYDNFLICSHLQDNGKGEELTRCTRTAEEINDYLCNTIDKSTIRLYIRDNEDIEWWSTEYYKHARIDDSLLNANIWNTTPNDISSIINSGVSLVFYNGHGDIDRFKYFNYTTTELGKLNNIFYPIFFNTTCLTGAYHVDKTTGKSICSLSTELLKLKEAGASAAIASSTVTSVGCAEALKIGLFDAIWPSKKLAPIFNNNSVSVPYISQSLKYCRLGEILEYGKIRMSQWIKDNSIFNRHKIDTFNTFYVVGDPSMEFYKDPQKRMPAIIIDKSGLNIKVDASLVVNPDIHLVNERTGECETFFSTKSINVIVNKPEDYTIGITAKGYFPYVVSAWD